MMFTDGYEGFANCNIIDSFFFWLSKKGVLLSLPCYYSNMSAHPSYMLVTNFPVFISVCHSQLVTFQI